MDSSSYFTLKSGLKLPVDKNKYLLSILSSTSDGTEYWQPPPNGGLTERQYGRVILQVHQILDIFRSCQVDLLNKSMLDIGTGNGLVPRLMLALSDLSSAIGTDPYLDTEHATSWQLHDHSEAIKNVLDYLTDRSPNTLRFSTYSNLSSEESASFFPGAIDFELNLNKKYSFFQKRADEVHSMNKVFDIVYCKAIEHISNWESVFSSVRDCTAKDAIFYLKHRSYFSYLGAHRYASTFIPWGHVILSEEEYEEYVKRFHPERANEMINFYKTDLSYPRTSVSDLLDIARAYGFAIEGIRIDKHRRFDLISRNANEIANFSKVIRRFYPTLSNEELFSGMYHIVLRKI